MIESILIDITGVGSKEWLIYLGVDSIVPVSWPLSSNCKNVTTEQVDLQSHCWTPEKKTREKKGETRGHHLPVVSEANYLELPTKYKKRCLYKNIFIIFIIVTVESSKGFLFQLARRFVWLRQHLPCSLGLHLMCAVKKYVIEAAALMHDYIINILWNSVWKVPFCCLE